MCFIICGEISTEFFEENFIGMTKIPASPLRIWVAQLSSIKFCDNRKLPALWKFGRRIKVFHLCTSKMILFLEIRTALSIAYIFALKKYYIRMNLMKIQSNATNLHSSSVKILSLLLGHMKVSIHTQHTAHTQTTEKEHLIRMALPFQSH